MVPLIGGYTVASFGGFIARGFELALLCRVIAARWTEINGETWRPRRSDYAIWPFALVCAFIYGTAISIGL